MRSQIHQLIKVFRTGIGSLMSIPDHRQGIRCKAPRSDDRGVWINTPQGGAIEGNAADDALLADQGVKSNLTFLVV